MIIKKERVLLKCNCKKKKKKALIYPRTVHVGAYTVRASLPWGVVVLTGNDFGLKSKTVEVKTNTWTLTFGLKSKIFVYEKRKRKYLIYDQREGSTIRKRDEITGAIIQGWEGRKKGKCKFCK